MHMLPQSPLLLQTFAVALPAPNFSLKNTPTHEGHVNAKNLAGLRVQSPYLVAQARFPANPTRRRQCQHATHRPHTCRTKSPTTQEHCAVFRANRRQPKTSPCTSNHPDPKPFPLKANFFDRAIRARPRSGTSKADSDLHERGPHEQSSWPEHPQQTTNKSRLVNLCRVHTLRRPNRCCWQSDRLRSKRAPKVLVADVSEQGSVQKPTPVHQVCLRRVEATCQDRGQHIVCVGIYLIPFHAILAQVCVHEVDLHAFSARKSSSAAQRTCKIGDMIKI